MANYLSRRSATLYTLLRATLNRSAEVVEFVPLHDVTFIQHAIRERSPRKGFEGKLVSYSGHFVEGRSRIHSPFYIAFAGSHQASGIHNRMAVTGAVSIENQFRAMMAIMSHLVSRGDLPRSAFDETVRATVESRQGKLHHLSEVTAGFHAWASNLIKRSPLDPEEKQQSLAELLSYEVPVERVQRVAA
jgi:hypothetical protein